MIRAICNFSFALYFVFLILSILCILSILSTLAILSIPCIPSILFIPSNLSILGVPFSFFGLHQSTGSHRADTLNRTSNETSALKHVSMCRAEASCPRGETSKMQPKRKHAIAMMLNTRMEGIATMTQAP